jgi:UDPglucose 6-dehydrogenase
MTSVGVVGLGKLGMPTAIVMSQIGCYVRGYDIDPQKMTLDALPPYELDAAKAGPLSAQIAEDLPLHFCSLEEVVNESECIFVAVETPHGELYEGVTPLPESRADFSYDALASAVRAIMEVARQPVEIGVISTALPGTIRKLVLPIVGASSTLVYCPQFVAMGTVAYDLRHPEFTLLGYADRKPTTVKAVLEALRIDPAQTFEMSYESAELAKVTYNTFIGAKVAISNVVQQTAHMTGASATDVFAVLRSAHRRLASAGYMGPGMGDGGPCHPRDNIALSWLARELGMGADLFSALMLQRQDYVEWLIDEFVAAAGVRPLVLLGTAYKPGTPLETGSSSILMANILAARGQQVTLVRTPADLARLNLDHQPSAYFIGCPDAEFLAVPFPPGSVVIDPWHVVEPGDGLDVRRVGEPQLNRPE